MLAQGEIWQLTSAENMLQTHVQADTHTQTYTYAHYGWHMTNIVLHAEKRRKRDSKVLTTRVLLLPMPLLALIFNQRHSHYHSHTRTHTQIHSSCHAPSLAAIIGQAAHVVNQWWMFLCLLLSSLSEMSCLSVCRWVWGCECVNVCVWISACVCRRRQLAVWLADPHMANRGT